MPIYEFRCECGAKFEKLCKFNDGSLASCPACGKESRRVMSAFRTGRSSGGSETGAYSAGSSCGSCSSSNCSSCH